MRHLRRSLRGAAPRSRVAAQAAAGTRGCGQRQPAARRARATSFERCMGAEEQRRLVGGVEAGRKPQAAHAGVPGRKMRAFLRRIQRAYFRRNRSAGSRATSVAVRSRRWMSAHMHFAAVFHIKTLPVLGRSCDRAESGFKTLAGGQDARVFAIVRAFLGEVAYVFFCAKAFFGGLCYNFFGKQDWNLHPHCRRARLHRGDKTCEKNRP